MAAACLPAPARRRALRSPPRRTSCRSPLASLLGGSPTGTVSALLVLAVPLSLWGSWRLLRVVGRLIDAQGFPRWLLLWGALTYALVPVVSGAWGLGRFGIVVAATVLPWLAHAALGFADPEPDRRWRAAWRSGLLLRAGRRLRPAGVLARRRTRGRRGRCRVPDRAADDARSLGLGSACDHLATVPVLLLAPWWLPALHELGGTRAAVRRRPPADVEGRVPRTWPWAGSATAAPPGGSASSWSCSPSRPSCPLRTRVPVLVCWVVALVAAVLAAALTLVEFDPRRRDHRCRPGLPRGGPPGGLPGRARFWAPTGSGAPRRPRRRGSAAALH